MSTKYSLLAEWRCVKCGKVWTEFVVRRPKVCYMCEAPLVFMRLLKQGEAFSQSPHN
jgi:hypothetical protein